MGIQKSIIFKLKISFKSMRKNKLIKLLPFIPLATTIIVSFIYLIITENDRISFSPPQLSPNFIAANFAITILVAFVISIIFMLV